MASPFFRFKQFTVWHDRCAMKVGTDGVLLGAWCPIQIENPSNTFNILDIGTGSGLIALMLAQRAPYALITAIDIDQKAVEQAQYNFSISPWKERLECHLSALQQVEGEELFDLIVSNPPYFQDSLKNPDNQRAMARHTDTLSYEELLSNSARLLKQQATLALVLPIEAEQQIITIAQTHKLYPTHITHVYPKPGKAAKRLLIAFSLLPIANSPSPIANSLTLESATSPRSEEYKNLTLEFYL
ncbi:MAG: methyltransferase [Paludibacteraceae bacterium]|nr:methyltransferase [Paludibacteraceae bacterium]